MTQSEKAIIDEVVQLSTIALSGKIFEMIKVSIDLAECSITNDANMSKFHHCRQWLRIATQELKNRH